MPPDTELPAAEAGSPSLEDRIAQKLGLASPEEESTADADSESIEAAEAADEDTPVETGDFDEIEYEGSRYQVPKGLKDAFMHKSDYTRKSQEIADRNRALEAQQSALQVAQLERDFYSSVTSEASTIQMIDAQVKDMTDNWASLTADQKQDLHLLDKRREQLVSTIREKQQQFNVKAQTARNEMRAKSMDAIAKSIPNWGEKVKNDIISHAKTDGYSEAELSNILDPRHAKTLYKAMMFDQMQAKAKQVQKLTPNAKAAPSRPMPSAVKAKLNFAKKIAATAADPQARKAVLNDRIGAIFGG